MLGRGAGAACNRLNFSSPSVLVFILTLLLLSVDFYYLKNIAGRRLVGLRWWNEVNTSTGDSHWVFESAEPGSRVVNATDKRFFWLTMYAAPALWVGLAVLALVRFLNAIWLVIVGEWLPPARVFHVLGARGRSGRGRRKKRMTILRLTGEIAIALVLTVTNTVAFSRCDKFSQASNLANSAFIGGGFARNLAGNMVGRLFR